jgi:putative hydrolase of the HAD superfamily
VDLYFFDLDKTLYAYDFRHRLPELSRLSGASEYRIAKEWWAGGFERRSEAGEWPTTDEYLDAFADVTGGRRLTLDEWTHARSLAMTRITGSVKALERAATLGRVSLLSNNPAPLAEALPRLAPDVSTILRGNVLVSYMLGARKPSRELFERALDHYGVDPEDAFLADDSADNVEGARAVGITAHHFEYVRGTPQTDALEAAITAFSGRHE